ncbi:hypothetical protein CMQ_6054 [Grosmannia clavigera kw1407]|uniref:Uncharacterized protein n=1 Tax=Grosmannia clavigera (strain kw1407 / UAMH 11150) TaxID=655863 RepID=F0XMR5_GROCL|nr:uncharacterized protein CMQ_6054 [Grosmannia clavigera kw1407]EFX01112.1 hypothetical protein CMQ_6054 [Grosmannia clavigera kw1407]
MSALNPSVDLVDNAAAYNAAIADAEAEKKKNRGSYQVVTSILELIPTDASEYGEVCGFGQICVELAEQIPYYHPSQLKLVKLLQELGQSSKFKSKYPL